MQLTRAHRSLMMNPFIQKALTRVRQFPPKEVIFKSSVPEAEKMQWHIYRDPKTGSIMTSDRLRVMIDAVDRHGTPHAYLRDVFAIGDCAVIQHTKYPATAQVANQKAKWLATRLNKGDLGQQRFTFRNLGMMAYVSNWKVSYPAQVLLLRRLYSCDGSTQASTKVMEKKVGLTRSFF
jgi:hypothetical protein